MKRVSMIVGASALFAWSLAAALGGCGGSEESDVTANELDGSPSNGSSGSSGGNGSSGSSGSSGTPSDGGSNDAAPDGSSGGLSNPGQITCGATQCNASNQICCQGLNDAGCVDDDDPCQGARLSCDETADCDQGERCCFGLGGGGGGGGGAGRPRARCQDNCQNQFRLCKTNAECGDGGACTEKTCGMVKVRTCGDLIGCN